jgi:hypothetical protein
MFSPFILLRSVYQHHEPLYPTRDLFPVEQWVHVAWVWNRYTATLYVNGAEAYATPMAMRFLHEPPAAEGGLELGMAGAADFDEVRIYGRPLSPAELAREHGRYRPGARPLRVGAAGAMVCDFRGPNRLAGSVFACSGTVANAAGCDIVLKKGARAVAGTFLRVGGEGETPFIWDLPPAVSSGTFQLGIAFRDGEGKLLLSGEQTLERAAYPWLNNAVGLDDRVLHPWTPVQAKGRQISVVGRDFTLGDGGLFSAIRNWGHDLLAAPMRLEMATRRGPGEFAGGRAAVTVRKPGSVAWSGEGSFAWGTARRLAVRVDGRLEYDGAARLALEFDPGVDPVEVSALALVIPVSAAYAELCSWMIGSFMHLAVQVPTPDYGPFGSELSRRDGEVFSSKALYEAYFPGNIVQSGIGRFRLPTVGNYLPQVWFGNNEGGLSIFGDNDQGWVPTNDAPAIQVVRRGHTADIRLNFIAAPHWLDRRRTVVLGLLPTPVKPLPADWRRVSYHPDSWAPWASSTTYLADPEDERQNLADLKARVAEIHRKGRKSAPHINGAFFEAGPRTRRAFAAEWHDANAYAPYGMFSASKCDFMAWTYAFWKREIGIDGVYFDCATPEPNFNILSGTAYRLEDGRVQPGWTIWNERALFKRAAHVFGDLYRANYAWGNGFNHPEISGWLPSLVMGEGCEITTRDNRELVGRWLRGVPGHDMHPLRYYSETIPGTFGLERLQGISHPWGIIRLWQFPHFRLFETPAWTNDSPEAVRQVQTFSRSALSQILLLDTQPEWCGRFPGWYTNFTGRADLTFYGFWNNGELLARTPADVRVNAYVAGRDLLVIASNPGMEKTPVTVTADLAGLGLAPAAGKPAAVVDAEAGATWGRNVVDVYAKHLWDGPTLLPEAERAVKADTAGGKVTLAFAVNPQDYRAFRVTVP